MRVRLRRPMIDGRPRLWADAGCCLAVVCVGVALSVPSWSAPIAWAGDNVAYQAKMLHYAGASTAVAESDAFHLEVGYATANGDSVADARARFRSNMVWFRRRALVPAVASRLYPRLGSRSIQAVSIAAYVLLGAALFVFLRLRFSSLHAAGVAALTLVFPPLRRWSVDPLTDSAALLFLVCALTTAALTLKSGRRWLIPWVLALALGSVTRETIVAPVLAAGVLAAWRTRRAPILLLAGVAAVAPAMLLLRFPFKEAFAEAAARQLRVPVDTSFLALLEHWLFLALTLPVRDVLTEPVWTLVLVAAVAFVALRRDDSTVGQVARASALGGLLYLASFPFVTNLRLELVLVPAAAYGVALASESAARVGHLALARFARGQRQAEPLSALSADPNGSTS